MTPSPWLVFAGGGTGGHLFPALAVVESLRERYGQINVSFFCTRRPIDRDILGAAGVEAVPLSVQPVTGRPWRWPAFLARWRESISRCRHAFLDRRPAVVVGAGGYASGPPVAAALGMGIPTFLLNPDAVPGRANRHLARRRILSPGRRLTGIFAQWPVTGEHFPPTAPVVVTGCPVRRSFRTISTPGHDAEASDRKREPDIAEIRRSFDLDPDCPTLLVTGASQGARTINEAMIHLAGPLTPTGWQVFHLSGSADRERVARAYTQAGMPGIVRPFTDRMAEAMAAADLIVSRAGASTLGELLVTGKPSLLLPYPYHRDRHQWHNGAVLTEAGAAVMLEDVRDASANARRMGSELTALMTDDGRRAEMAHAARRLSRPEAADRVADTLARTAEIKPSQACEFSSDHPVGFFSRRTA